MSAKINKETKNNVIDYTPTVDTPAGTVVDLGGGEIGVVQTDLLANQLGSAYFAGIFNVTKATGFAITDLSVLYYDTSAGELVVAPNANTVTIGSAHGDAASGDTVAKVRLNQFSPNASAGLSNALELTGDAAPALSVFGTTLLDGNSNAVAATLANGSFIGQMKFVKASSVTNAVTLSVTSHATSNPEVFTFTTINQALLLMWNGSRWTTVVTVETPTV